MIHFVVRHRVWTVHSEGAQVWTKLVTRYKASLITLHDLGVAKFLVKYIHIRTLTAMAYYYYATEMLSLNFVIILQTTCTRDSSIIIIMIFRHYDRSCSPNSQPELFSLHIQDLLCFDKLSYDPIFVKITYYYYRVYSPYTDNSSSWQLIGHVHWATWRYCYRH